MAYSYSHPISRSSERSFAIVIQINAEHTAIVAHQREEEFALANVP